MATKPGQVMVKMSEGAYRLAKAAAALKGVPVQDYISQAVEPVARKDLTALGGRNAEDKPKKKSKTV